MSRIARVVVPGMPHHVTQRGIRRLVVFRDDPDRRLYLDLFAESAQRYGLTIRSYALMPNHVHFIVTPLRPDSINKAFHRCHGVYANRFNEKYSLVGHLWQQRPFSCVLSERHLRNALRYVETNPVRAALVTKASDYEWSSARAHCLGSADRLLSSADASAVPGWEDWLSDRSHDPKIDQFIRDCTFSGRPCGDEEFLRELEALTNRRLMPRKRGPKRRDRDGGNLSFDWGESERKT